MNHAENPSIAGQCSAERRLAITLRQANRISGGRFGRRLARVLTCDRVVARISREIFSPPLGSAGTDAARPLCLFGPGGDYRWGYP